MALFLLNPGTQPLGSFDLLDTDGSTGIKGGELMCLDNAARTNTASETAAADVDDAYNIYSAAAYRTVACVASDARLLSGSTVGDGYCFYLSDDGTLNYGVLFGSVIGGSTGLVTGKGNSTATNYGPASNVGSGKVTLWDKPGLYAVSLDAIDSSLIATNPGTITSTPVPGTALYRSSTGKLAVVAQVAAIGSSTLNKVAAFVELTNSGGLVQTPARLFSTTPTTAMYDRIVIQYYGTGKNA